MIKISIQARQIESLSFDFNLNSKGKIKTTRDLSWVEENPLTVNANLKFAYKHYPANTMHQSDWELKIKLDNVILDFRNDCFVFDNQEYQNPWPFNLMLFRATSTHFILHGSYKPPLQMFYYANDIVIFECAFEHSTVMDKEIIKRFTQFNFNQSGKVLFEISP
jgi:hypothetical protein